MRPGEDTRPTTAIPLPDTALLPLLSCFAHVLQLSLRTTLADLSLISHPSCRWFVLTTSSNFARMANQLRKTDGLRVDAPLMDLEKKEWR